ncbi:cleavage and polyadenylation specificity factor subunit 1 [Aplysia californica]|uniref:Cleavage and polyadenylation specificity factor subunit 1 n=1 Tax=Aplysia californica TaxID=6500 RepID=A0ABM1AG59_APLCA|nr:cleavage and polyadenylation specificity factor subunit 1 [Aplysia californica]XP_012947010.1 cleavage and polyadenylation specificity factor subunit 1 [Aplysia californica]
MHCMYKQIHPSTGIEHCIFAHFFSWEEKNLIIAGVNQLHVYRLNSESELVTPDGILKEPTELSDDEKTRLECLASYSLHGNIQSLEAVKLSGAHRDVILLSFSDAKLSVVEYDPSTHDLKTCSLHQFEEHELRGGYTTTTHLPVIRVDPDGRCAGMLIYGTHLVVLPFRKEVAMDELDAPSGAMGKSPIMSSYIIDLRKMDEKIINILDIQFLHGYFEPTVFILYEPLATWSGRTAVRTDTCSIVAISLNIQQKVHPIIWSQANLPFDSFSVCAIPKPIGGVMIFAVNSLMYLNQSVPPFGVSLNSIADSSSAFPLKAQENVHCALDCVRHALISNDRLVLSLKGGELYVLTLVIDGMRCVRGFHFDRAASSVLTTCMCVCGDSYLFLGSRLGNSLLLKYTEKSSGTVIQAEERRSGGPVIKKRRVEGLEQLASDVTEIENVDELEVYGSIDNQPGTMIASYTFEVCDNIWNIAPCAQVAMGEPAFLSEEYSSHTDPDLELVTTSGHGKNGAISVLQHSIRPQVVTTFSLSGCIDLWTVYSPSTTADAEAEVEETTTKEGETETESSPPQVANGHAFLVLSRRDSSMVLQTGSEINELDHSGFSTQTATVFVGNIGENRYILQVSPTAMRLLEGIKQIQHIPVDLGSSIQSCSVCDPHVVVMGVEGQIMMFTLRDDRLVGGARLSASKTPVAQTPRVVAVATYRDFSGLFTTDNIRQGSGGSGSTTEKIRPADKVPVLHPVDIDDEDEMLYGDTSFAAASEDVKVNAEGSDGVKKEKKEIKPTSWLLVSRVNGQLEIYSLPEYKLSYTVKSFPLGQRTLVHSGPTFDATKSGTSSGTSEKQSTVDEMPVVKEVQMFGLGHNKSRPYLMARVDEDLLIYEAYPHCDAHITGDHLRIRFRKVPHGLILREKKAPAPQKGDDEEEPPDENTPPDHIQQLRYFEDVSGYAGVFVCGPFPHWIFMTPKGSLRIHPMGIDGWITCFTPFHNVNCPKGFLYFNRKSDMCICVLPTHVTYDAPWPIRKVPLRCTPHLITYHSDSKLYAVVTSVKESTNKFPRVQSDDREWDYVERNERFIYPEMAKYTVQLFTPSTWEVIPDTKYDCEDWEYITCLENAQLKSEGTISGFKGFITMGTAYCMGEDVVARGRIIILDVIEVVPEPGQPLTKNKIKVVYDKEQKGPVSAIAYLNGLLVTAIGQKIYIWSLKDDDLSGVAFIDSLVYIHSLRVVKNLILASDVIKSVALYRYQDELRVLSFVSRDSRALETYAGDFLVDGERMSFVVSDRSRNIFIYCYLPEVRESHGGIRLLRRADFNLGSQVNSMFRVRCKLEDPSTSKKNQAAVEHKQVTFFATLDGGIGYLLPIQEKVFRRQQMLQNAMITQLPNPAGLNPKAYRTYKTLPPDMASPQRNILDGELCWRFLHLSTMEKIEVAKKIGTSVDQLIDDLMEFDRLTAHF